MNPNGTQGLSLASTRRLEPRPSHVSAGGYRPPLLVGPTPRSAVALEPL